MTQARDGFTEELDRCLSLTVKGKWGHFRRVEGNVVKQTYRVIPRTTVAGLVAAVLGMDRDSYYDLFRDGASAIATEPVSELRTINMPVNALTTSGAGLNTLNSRGKLSVTLPRPEKNRQQHNYEVLVDPAYRIDLWLSNREIYDELRSYLEEGRSHYVPSLGLSEHLAEIEYHGEFEVNGTSGGDSVAVDSAVPGDIDSIVPEPGVRCHFENSPGYMATDGGGRTTTGYISYAYSPDGDALTAKGLETSHVDGRNVIFC